MATLLRARHGETDWNLNHRWQGHTGPSAMAERVLRALNHIAREHSDERVLVVTSGGPIRAAQAHLDGVDQPNARRNIESVANCGLVELVVRDGVFAYPSRERSTQPP